MTSYWRYTSCVDITSLHVILLWLAMSSDASDIHCKMKSGCSTHCDPKGWNKIEDHLFNKEFSITCMNNEDDKLRKEIEGMETKHNQLKNLILVIQEKHEKEIEDLITKNRNMQNMLLVLQENQDKEIEDIRGKNKNLRDSLTKIQENLDKENIKDFKNVSKNLENKSKSFKESQKKVDNGNCPILYDNKCFFPVVNIYAKIKKAQSICAERGANLANIYDKTHLDMINSHIREKHLNGWDWIGLWIGMTYNTSNGKVFLSNGKEATHVRWRSGYPHNISGWTAIMIVVDKSPSFEYQYMGNYQTSHQTAKILCEI